MKYLPPGLRYRPPADEARFFGSISRSDGRLVNGMVGAVVGNNLKFAVDVALRINEKNF